MLSARKKLWIEIVLHLMFWAGVFYVLTSLDSSHIRMQAKVGVHESIMRDGYDDQPISVYVYVIFIFLAALFYGNIFWLFPKVIRYKKIIIRLAIGALWFTMIFGANYFIVRPLFDQANPVPQPPPLLISTANRQTAFKSEQPKIKPDEHDFRPLRPGDPVPHPRFEAISFMIRNWQEIQPVLLFAFLVMEGLALAYFFLKAWTNSELIHGQLQASQLNTEIKFLKSQINPHFLFNTLNNLFSMAQAKGNDELADGISKLSGMMRYMLHDSNEDSVRLSKEITYLEECITLNKLRYADGEVLITFKYPAQTADIRIAPMLFIPFIENAFKHGVAIGQRSAIQIALAVSHQKLIFSCENIDHSKIRKMEMEISGIGLENVIRRLELVYPKKHRLHFKKEDGKFVVNLEIDLS